MNFFEILYSQKNGAALPANFFDLLFAKSFTPVIEWGEYDGALPAQYSANGSALGDYRIYGAAGGAGDDSGTAYGYSVPMSVGRGNLFDPSDTTPDYRYNDNGNWVNDKGVLSSGYMKVATGDKYEYKFKTVEGKNDGICRINFLNASGQWLSVNKVSFNVAVGATVTVSGTAPAGTAFIRTSQFNGEQNISLVIETDIPIYIGADPLSEDEYVSFEEQKVYRRTENLFDKNAKDATNGYEAGHYINKSGVTVIDAKWDVTEYIPCIQQTTYCFSKCVGFAASICWYDSNKNFISGSQIQAASGFVNRIITSPANASYVRTCVLLEHVGSGNQQYDRNVEVFMITEDSTAPEQYIPYLQPTDPPVPLPALPTVDGANIVDYAGQSAAPSRFYAKYQKG